MNFFRLALIISALPNTISNGQVADATPLMADLNHIVNQVNANAAELANLALLNATNTFTQPQFAAPALSSTHVPIVRQIQDMSFLTLSSVLGTDALTARIAGMPLPAYANGQIFTFIPSRTNTGAMTLRIDGLGTSAVQLAGSDIRTGSVMQSLPVTVRYQSPNFHMLGNSAMIPMASAIIFSNNQVLVGAHGAARGYSNLTFDGTTLTAPTIVAATAVNPDANDGAALGTSAFGWSDLFLASGALIDFANGNAVLTHSTGILTVSTGDLRVTTASTNAASVVTVGGTQTLTAKTLTSPTITTSPTAAGATWTDLGSVTTADINGGTIDGTTQASGTINGPMAAGGTWTAAATWTLPALTLGGTVSGGGQQINNVVIGTVTPLAGSFTTGAFSSTVTLSGTAANIALGSNFISNGGTDAGLSLDASNNATLSGNLTVSGTGTSLMHQVSGAVSIGGAGSSTAGQLLMGTTTTGGLFAGGTKASFVSTSQVLECVTSGAATVSDVDIWHQATSGNNLFERFVTEGGAGTIRGSIDFDRAGVLTRYNTTSDQRLKIDRGIATKPLYLPALKIHNFEWKETGNLARGVFAQEAYAVFPDAISIGTDGDDLSKPWGASYSAYVPDLIVGWQNHESRLAELERRVSQ